MQLTRRSFGLAALGALAAPAWAKAPFTGAQAPGVYRLKVGAFEVTVLNDGWLPLEAASFSGDAASGQRLTERGRKAGFDGAENHPHIRVGLIEGWITFQNQFSAEFVSVIASHPRQAGICGRFGVPDLSSRSWPHAGGAALGGAESL